MTATLHRLWTCDTGGLDSPGEGPCWFSRSGLLVR
jgi:hypothetical protein